MKARIDLDPLKRYHITVEAILKCTNCSETVVIQKEANVNGQDGIDDNKVKLLIESEVKNRQREYHDCDNNTAGFFLFCGFRIVDLNAIVSRSF